MSRLAARPIFARIDLKALRHNYAVAARTATGARVWSVVKADAYGHGLLPLALALREHTDGFALIELEGAILLREQGVRQPIMLLEGFYSAEELPLFAEHSLTVLLHAPWQIDALIEARLPVSLPVVLKLNTGMHRLGLSATEFRDGLARLEQAGCTASITLMTHFAEADGERGIAEQMQRFEEVTAGLSLPRCLANSAALLRFPAEVCDASAWVRPGIMLYGASPCPDLHSAEHFDLRPVMTLQSEIIAVQRLQRGDRVGYGGSFVAETEMTVGIVAGGYGDGYPRHAPTGTPLLVNGQRTRTLGRVSMDKLCVDLTGLVKVGAGSTAVLWGRDAQSGTILPADEVATAAGTIAYELFCALAGRVPVEYIE